MGGRKDFVLLDQSISVLVKCCAICHAAVAMPEGGRRGGCAKVNLVKKLVALETTHLNHSPPPSSWGRSGAPPYHELDLDAIIIIIDTANS